MTFFLGIQNRAEQYNHHNITLNSSIIRLLFMEHNNKKGDYLICSLCIFAAIAYFSASYFYSSK